MTEQPGSDAPPSDGWGPPPPPPPSSWQPLSLPPSAGGGAARTRRRILVSVLAGAVVVLLGFGSVAYQAFSTIRESRDQLSAIEGFGDVDLDGPTLEDSTEPLTAAELYGDQEFRFEITTSDRVMAGELRLLASFDHPDCVAAAPDDDTRQALADCGYRIEAVYAGAEVDLRVSQQVLVFADEASAEAFHARIEDGYAGEALTFEDPGDPANSGYAATRTGHRGVYVVLTLVVSESDGEDAVVAAQEHAHARHVESVTYFIWR